MKNETQSIYGLLVNSEEKGRSIMETAVYAVCILSGVVAIWQFIGQPAPLSYKSLVCQCSQCPSCRNTP